MKLSQPAATITVDEVFLEFTYRTSSTFGEVDIDTNMESDYMANEATFFKPGDKSVWWAACIDLSATYHSGTKLTPATSGKLGLVVGGSDCIAVIDYNYEYTTADQFVRVRKP